MEATLQLATAAEARGWALTLTKKTKASDERRKVNGGQSKHYPAGIWLNRGPGWGATALATAGCGTTVHHPRLLGFVLCGCPIHADVRSSDDA